MHHSYLFLMAQMHSKKRAKLLVEGKEVHVGIQPRSNKWEFSTKIFTCDEAPSKLLKEVFCSSYKLPLNTPKSKISYNKKAKTISFVDESAPLVGFTEFRKYLVEYLKEIDEWEKLAVDLA